MNIRRVQQGNPLSPLLFNLYINDLFKNITSKNPISLDNTNHFNALMYADDLIILSTSKEGLQSNLNALNDYCKKWKLDINYVKTKCLTFTNGTQKEKHNFTLNSETIENVKEYKYLGITINSKKCSFIPTLADLGCKGKRALYSINYSQSKPCLSYLMYVSPQSCYMEVKSGEPIPTLTTTNGNQLLLKNYILN